MFKRKITLSLIALLITSPLAANAEKASAKDRIVTFLATNTEKPRKAVTDFCKNHKVITGLGVAIVAVITASRLSQRRRVKNCFGAVQKVSLSDYQKNSTHPGTITLLWKDKVIPASKIDGLENLEKPFVENQSGIYRRDFGLLKTWYGKYRVITTEEMKKIDWGQFYVPFAGSVRVPGSFGHLFEFPTSVIKASITK